MKVVSNAIPLAMYHLMDRVAARELLGLNASGTVLFTGAHSLEDRRAGTDLLLGALRVASVGPVTLITMGGGSLRIEIEGVKHRHLGYVTNEHTKVYAFNAADLFVCPAPAANQPLACLESIACGTPVVAFDVCGLPEVVRPGQTGWLAARVSSDSLARVLEEAVRDLSRGMDLRASCRRVAEIEYRPETQAARYLDLYGELIERAKTRTEEIGVEVRVPKQEQIKRA